MTSDTGEQGNGQVTVRSCCGKEERHTASPQRCSAATSLISGHDRAQPNVGLRPRSQFERDGERVTVHGHEIELSPVCGSGLGHGVP